MKQFKILVIVALIFCLAASVVSSMAVDVRENETCIITFKEEYCNLHEGGHWINPETGERFYEYGVCEITLTVDIGHVITEEDLPVWADLYDLPAPGAQKTTTFYYGDWDVDPLGLVVEEDIVITYMLPEECYVGFISRKLYVDGVDGTIDWYAWDETFDFISIITVPRGGSVTMPEAPAETGYEFVEWQPFFNTTEFDPECITEYRTYVRAFYLPVGDCNMDNSVNTGDAALILRYIIGDVWFTDLQGRLADINGDGSVNTGDASAVLLYTIR